MELSLIREIELFRSFHARQNAHAMIEFVGPDILRFRPRIKNSKTLKVGILGLVHGNETIGLPILNSLLEQLFQGDLDSDLEIYFGLGNLPAAEANQRFLNVDLNRSFGQKRNDQPEYQRAREIETNLLDHVDYLVDIHQTIQPTETPFFIFQYNSLRCFRHLHLMNPGLATILQFDAIGDSDQLSTDEYLRSRNRFGTALELGQIGSSEQQLRLGISICANFIQKLNSFSHFHELHKPVSEKLSFPLYEITGKVSAEDEVTELDSHWQNFKKFQVGERLGQTSKGPLQAQSSGLMLFPKLGQQVKKGQALFHSCQPVHFEKVKEKEILY